MGQFNENKEEEERKIGVGSSVGCLILILILFGMLVVSLVLMIVSKLSGGQII